MNDGPYPSQSSRGMFVPTTNIWDINVRGAYITAAEFKDIYTKLYQNINNICVALNAKDTGYYIQEEFQTGQLLFPNPMTMQSQGNAAPLRPIFRIEINIGQLPNTSTVSIPHGLNIMDNFSFVKVLGSASNTSGHKYIPLPYVSADLSKIVEVNVDTTYINIITNYDATLFDTSYITLEYVKQ